MKATHDFFHDEIESRLNMATSKQKLRNNLSLRTLLPHYHTSVRPTRHRKTFASQQCHVVYDAPITIRQGLLTVMDNSHWYNIQIREVLQMRQVLLTSSTGF
jgi:hypothetical protein